MAEGVTCQSICKVVGERRERDPLRILPLTGVDEKAWAQFVEDCDQCWLFHHPDFFDISDPDSRSFAILDDDKIVGGCILMVNRSGLGRVLGYRYGGAGLAVRRRISSAEYSRIKNYIVDLARENACHAIQMNLPRLAPGNLGSSYLDTHLYQLGFGDSLRWGASPLYSPSFSTILDLAQSNDSIWRDFSELIRRKCKLAAKLGFDVEFLQNGAARSAWDAFERTHAQTMMRGGANELPSALRARLSKLVLNDKAAILNLSRYGDVIASLLLLTYKNAAFYFASGVVAEAYDSGFAAQLHWSAVEELRRRGYAIYEIGQYFPALGKSKLKSIGDFKRMFGGYKRRVLAGELVVNEARMFLLDLVPAHLRRCLKSRPGRA